MFLLINGYDVSRAKGIRGDLKGEGYPWPRKRGEPARCSASSSDLWRGAAGHPRSGGHHWSLPWGIYGLSGLARAERPACRQVLSRLGPAFSASTTAALASQRLHSAAGCGDHGTDSIHSQTARDAVKPGGSQLSNAHRCVDEPGHPRASANRGAMDSSYSMTSLIAAGWLSGGFVRGDGVAKRQLIRVQCGREVLSVDGFSSNFLGHSTSSAITSVEIKCCCVRWLPIPRLRACAGPQWPAAGFVPPWSWR